MTCRETELRFRGILIPFLPLLVLLVASIGCSGPDAVNARLVGDWPHLEDSIGKNQADIVLVAQRQELRPYNESQVFGNSEGWYFVTWSVQHVEQGQWKDETLKFVFHESTYGMSPETIEHLDLAPYHRHAIMRFWLRRGWGPPTIVAQEPATRP